MGNVTIVSLQSMRYQYIGLLIFCFCDHEVCLAIFQIKRIEEFLGLAIFKEKCDIAENVDKIFRDATKYQK